MGRKLSKHIVEKRPVRGIQGANGDNQLEETCEENLQRYDWDISRFGKELLADRYDDRTHFIFEPFP